MDKKKIGSTILLVLIIGTTGYFFGNKYHESKQIEKCLIEQEKILEETAKSFKALTIYDNRVSAQKAVKKEFDLLNKINNAPHQKQLELCADSGASNDV